MFFKNSDSGDKGRPVRVLPLLPLRDIIVFPHMVVPLFVGREKSIASLEEAMANGKDLLLAAQKMAKTNDPKPDDIFTVGTIGSIIQLLRLPDGTVKVLIEGKRRARIRKFLETADLFRVEVEEIVEKVEKTLELEALVRQVHQALRDMARSADDLRMIRAWPQRQHHARFARHRNLQPPAHRGDELVAPVIERHVIRRRVQTQPLQRHFNCLFGVGPVVQPDHDAISCAAPRFAYRPNTREIAFKQIHGPRGRVVRGHGALEEVQPFRRQPE